MRVLAVSRSTRHFACISGFITKSDISELDTLREYWHKNGGEAIIEFYNTWYAENVAK